VNLNSTAVRKILPLLALRPGEWFTLSSICAYAMYPEMKVIALRLLDVPAAMRKAGAKVDLAMAFGSLLRPTFGAQSDIDLLLITAQADAARRGVGEVETRLGKHFSPKVMDPARFSAALAKGDPFIREIMERPHAVLTGSLERFGDAA